MYFKQRVSLGVSGEGSRQFALSARAMIAALGRASLSRVEARSVRTVRVGSVMFMRVVRVVHASGNEV